MNKKPPEPLPKNEHPRGLHPEEKKEFHKLCSRIFELYDSMPMGKTKRKVLAGCNEKGSDTCLLMFKGSPEDLFKMREFLDQL